MEISIYANFGRVYGQKRSKCPNIVAYFFKWDQKRNVFPKKNYIKICIVAIFHPKIKNLFLDMFIDVLTLP